MIFDQKIFYIISHDIVDFTRCLYSSHNSHIQLHTAYRFRHRSVFRCIEKPSVAPVNITVQLVNEANIAIMYIVWYMPQNTCGHLAHQKKKKKTPKRLKIEWKRWMLCAVCLFIFETNRCRYIDFIFIFIPCFSWIFFFFSISV